MKTNTMKKYNHLGLSTLLLGVLLFLSSCSKDSKNPIIDLFFSPDDDIQLGLQTVSQIESKPAEYPLLDSASYKVAYSNIYRITNNILNSGKVEYRSKFIWRVRIIRDDSTLNAFCTPGGFIYVYTGLIKYLDNETQLAGVMGHEIAHADRRHSATSMVQQYGVATLLSVITGGDQSLLSEIAANLILLKYSRNHENEADEYSVVYLYPTEYDPRGAKYFFEKLLASGQSGGPAFLSTHPDPGDRVANITQKWQDLGGRTDGKLFVPEYQAFKNSLP